MVDISVPGHGVYLFSTPMLLRHTEGRRAMTNDSPDDSSQHEKATEVIVEDVKTTNSLSDVEPPIILTSEEESRLYRKIDLRLMPILTTLQVFSFMDRGIVN